MGRKLGDKNGRFAQGKSRKEIVSKVTSRWAEEEQTKARHGSGDLRV